MEGVTVMLGQIWSALTRKPQQAVLGAQLDPIVKYRLQLYLTTTSAGPAQSTSAAAVFSGVTGAPTH